VVVSVDAVATAAASSSTGVTTLSLTTLTVGAGATALLALITFDEQAAVASTPGTVNWDATGTPQAMTMLMQKQSANVNVDVRMYGLVNPTAGNKTLTATWTGSCPVVIDAMSFNGSINTTVANAFLHSVTNSGITGTPTVTVTSAVGNYVAGSGGSTTGMTSWTATGSSALFTYVSTNSENFRGGYAPGAATLAWTAGATSTEWATAGIDVVAATSVRKFVPWKQRYGAILAQ
jgi:hypothetical protein